jgi:DNA-binding NtrC family response regulator
MNVQSKPGHGSRFEAWLPAASAADAATIAPAQLPLGRGETVLVVEGERARLLRDEEMLAALGYEPIGFERAADAIAAFRAAPERFDALLLGQSPSVPDALDVARTLHGAAPRRPILLAAGASVDISVDAVTKAGIAEVLRRPLVGAELAAALARCLSA